MKRYIAYARSYNRLADPASLNGHPYGTKLELPVVARDAHDAAAKASRETGLTAVAVVEAPQLVPLPLVDVYSPIGSVFR